MIYIPTKIKVGYQNRADTYSKKLAYVIYYDAKGKLRKEPSWNGWRDQKIDHDDFENEPLSGFVLNKTAGGVGYSSWDTRKTYCRVYDPRGFEVEVDITNLLYILENTNSIVGKGLEGEFVYAWSGKDLILIPTKAKDYTDLQEMSEVLQNSEYVKSKEMEKGKLYENIKTSEKYVYAGKLNTFHTNTTLGVVIKNKPKFIFLKLNSENTAINFKYLESEDNDGDSWMFNYSFTITSSLPRLVKIGDDFFPEFARAMKYVDASPKFSEKLNRETYSEVKATVEDLQDLENNKFTVKRNDKYRTDYHRVYTEKGVSGLQYYFQANKDYSYYRTRVEYFDAEEFIKHYWLQKLVKN